MESINLKSITIRQNRLWQQTGDQADVAGWDILNRSLCGTLMDSPVHIIVSAHTWPATSTDVKDPSKLCVREPHVPSQRPLMEPVKTASRAQAASLILSPNYC